ncbi:MAG: hypothetical protein AAB431_03725, partial [Patescibacteria group bacterium]
KEPAKAVAKKTETKPAAKKVEVPAEATWDKSGLKALGSLASFDYQTSIRNAYMKKVENYARRNGIKTITGAVVKGMRE